MNRFFRNRHQHVAVVFIVFSLICCYGFYRPFPANGENSIAEELISLDIKNQPLVEVLEDISAETGYQFSIDESWNNFPITASIKNEPLHKGLKRILRNLNNAVIYGSDGIIKIKIYEQEKSSGYPAGHSIANRSYEETIQQPVIPDNPPPPNEQASEENSESEPEPDEADHETEETGEQSGTADEEAAANSDSKPAENSPEEDERQALETGMASENTPDSEAKEGD